MENKPFREILRKYRTDHRLTQAELAQILKVSQPTINAWESGKSKPTEKIAKEILHVVQEKPKEVCPKELSLFQRLVEHFKPDEIPLLPKIIDKFRNR